MTGGRFAVKLWRWLANVGGVLTVLKSPRVASFIIVDISPYASAVMAEGSSCALGVMVIMVGPSGKASEVERESSHEVNSAFKVVAWLIGVTTMNLPSEVEREVVSTSILNRPSRPWDCCS